MSEENREEQRANTALTEHVPDPNMVAMAEIAEVTSEHIGAAACNFPSNKVERYQLLSAATDGLSESIQDKIGEVIELRYWFVHSVELTDDSGGEITICPRVVIFDAEGKSYSAVSSGLFKALQLLLGAYGWGDLPQGVFIRFEQRKTRRGFRILTFVPAAKP